MKKLILLLALLIPLTLYAQPTGKGIVSIAEEDGSPEVFPWQVKVTNGSLTDNADGTASLTVPATASDLPIVDTNTYYRETNVETAFDELGKINELTNGTTLKATSLAVTSDGSDITASLSSAVGTTITFKFSTGLIDVDVTAPMTVVLTAGTDTVPVLNYLYVLASDPTTLVRSTTSFPSAENAHVGKVTVQTAGTVQSSGTIMQHTWVEDLSNQYKNGHIGHINSWVRHQWATWVSGVAPTISGTGTGTISWASTSGTVRRLHKKTFPAFSDGADVYAIDDPDTAYRIVTNIADLLKDSAGVSLTNKYYGLVFWGVINDNGESKIFVNLPSGSETTAAKARTDSMKYTNYSIPTAFKGVGFLIHRLIIRNAADTTWTIYTGTGDDLRGQFPNVVAGTSTAIGTVFPDNTFEVFDDGDVTKKVVFELSGMTTGKTLTLDSNITDNRNQLFPDASGTIVFKDTTDILTNKTLAAANNVIEADTVVTNANLTGEVTSIGNAAVIDPTAISGKADTTLAAEDFLLFWDASDSLLKKVDAGEVTAGAGDLKADGSVPLTANWDVGAYNIHALTFTSDQATGTAPFTVASTTEVANLKAATATLATTATTANAGDSATDFFSSGEIADAQISNTLTSSTCTGNSATVTNATLTTALTVDTGTVGLTGNVANNSVLTLGAGAVSVSGVNTGDQTINTADIADVSVIQTELAELETIGATTISANQWATLGGIAETLTNTELNLLDGIVTLSGANTGDNTVATSGDSATAFFDAGTIEHEWGGLQADISGYTGLIAITGADTTAEIDAESELTGQIADVSLFVTDDEWKTGTDPDVGTAGQLGVDTDDHSLRGYDGAAQYVYGEKHKQIDVTIIKPVDVDQSDILPIWKNRSAFTFVIIAVYADSDTDNVNFVLDERAPTNYTTTSEIAAIAVEDNGTGVYYKDTTGLTHVIDAGNVISVDLDATDDPNYLHFTIVGYFNSDID